MSQSILIRNAKLCLPEGIRQGDLLIEDGRISHIGTISPTENRSGMEIDAEGQYVLPGFIDMHIHVDDAINGVPLADSYESASRLAIQNGITTIYSFITQGKNEAMQAAVGRAVQKAQGCSYTDIGWHLTPLQWDAPSMAYLETLILRGFKTFKFYTTYKEGGLYLDYKKIEKLAGRLKQNDVRILVHCEDEHILERRQSRNFNFNDPESHAEMRPPEAEFEAIRRIIYIAARTGARFHIVHVSTTEGLELIEKEGRSYGVTCETAPHYFLLDRHKLSCKSGHYYLCTPPLREPSNRHQMMAYAKDARFDCFATDHCAFSLEEKERCKHDLRYVPKGIAGLGALAPSVFELYRTKGDSGMIMLLKTLCENPAKINGIFPRKGALKAGSDGDVVILKEGVFERSFRSTLSDSFEPYPNFKTRLHIAHVIKNGVPMVQNNQLTDHAAMKGKRLCLT